MSVVLSIIAVAAGAPLRAAPTGRLAYLQGGAAYVAPAAGGKAIRLPRSNGAVLVQLSPSDGTALYFVPVPHLQTTEGDPVCRGFLSRPPYRRVTLPFPLQELAVDRALWTATGQAVWLTGYDLRGSFRPRRGIFHCEPVFPESLSRDGRVAAYTTETEIKLRWPASGKEQVLFSTRHPEALFAAIRREGTNKGIEELAGEINPDMWRDASNWAFGPPALAPDGRDLFFAANMGTGIGAAGSTTFALFKAEVASGHLTVLGRAGSFSGRRPEQCEVSPDGRRLLVISSQHSSALENSRMVYVVNLRTMKVVELLHCDPESAGKENLTGDACWSPDSKFIAIDVDYYSVQKRMQQQNPEPKDADFTLYLKDAATGHTFRKIPGAQLPSWSCE